MTFPKLFVKEIDDGFTQENFKRVEDYFRSDPYDKFGFKFLEIAIPSSVSSQPFKHFLGYQPKDIILTHNLNNATITFHYSLFTSEDIFITSSAATTLRFLVGRYN
jgi:hypothetical protein